MADLTTIRNPINYLLELYQDANFTPILAIADSQFSRQYNVFAFSIAPHITDPANYWIAWGGYFDNPEVDDIAVFMDYFLTQVFSPSALIAGTSLFYVDTVNMICYINTQYLPWQYRQEYAKTYVDTNTTFCSAPLDPSNPSNMIMANKKVSPRLTVPSVNQRLNNIFSGVVTYNDFNVSLINNDGFFDALDMAQFFNTIMILKKTNQVNPLEFTQIRQGLVSNIDFDMSSVQITAYDFTYLMTNQVCDKITATRFPNTPADNINKYLPLAWGNVKSAPVFQIDIDSATTPTWIEYIICESNYLTDVSKVYDSNGGELTFIYTPSTGIIRVTELDSTGQVIPAVSADIAGKTTNNICEIILDIVPLNENLPYVNGVWDITEVEYYKTIAPNINLLFQGGTTKQLIEQVLKNDMAFLILKTDNILTIRKWGEIYGNYNIPNWAIMQNPSPKINYADALQNFASSILIKSEKKYLSGEYTNSYLNDTSETSIVYQYKRSYTPIYYLELSTNVERLAYSNLILNRFGKIRETLILPVGVDTYNVNLLDKITLTMTVNNRQMSQNVNWIVKQIDPAQDVLVLESTD